MSSPADGSRPWSEDRTTLPGNAVTAPPAMFGPVPPPPPLSVTASLSTTSSANPPFASPSSLPSSALTSWTSRPPTIPVDSASAAPLDTQLVTIASQLTPSLAPRDYLSRLILVHDTNTQRQSRINAANAQLHALHFFVGRAHAARADQLHRALQEVQADVVEGRAVLQRMAAVIARQEHALQSLVLTVGDVTAELGAQGESLTALEGRLEAQKAEFARVMAGYDSKLAEQRALLSRQEVALGRLLAVRFRIDAAVDAAVVLLAWVLTRLRPLRWGYAASGHAVARVVGALRPWSSLARRRAFARLVASLTHCATALWAVRALRGRVVAAGVHHQVGSFAEYVACGAGLAATAAGLSAEAASATVGKYLGRVQRAWEYVSGEVVGQSRSGSMGRSREQGRGQDEDTVRARAGDPATAVAPVVASASAATATSVIRYDTS